MTDSNEPEIRVKGLEWREYSESVDPDSLWVVNHVLTPDVEMYLEKTKYGWEFFVAEETIIEPCDTLESAKLAAEKWHSEQILKWVELT